MKLRLGEVVKYQIGEHNIRRERLDQFKSIPRRDQKEESTRKSTKLPAREILREKRQETRTIDQEDQRPGLKNHSGRKEPRKS